MTFESFIKTNSSEIVQMCDDWLNERYWRIRAQQKEYKRKFIKREMSRSWLFRAKTVKQALRRIDYSWMGAYYLIEDRNLTPAGRVLQLKFLAQASTDGFVYVSNRDMYTLTQLIG